MWWVYPRGCGGTSPLPGAGYCIGGLSPRVRGNPDERLGQIERRGSIPAGAGEPSRLNLARISKGVYPRGCGGTYARGEGMPLKWGLSPRVRGNPFVARCVRRLAGSIPAGAGEPPFASGRTFCSRVYPRGCGGTGLSPVSTQAEPGLSPRVRGNRGMAWQMNAVSGSIPAGAGEPTPTRAARTSGWVYPRGCGGTSARAYASRNSTGLSPRVRGNRDLAVLRGDLAGSIPAGAGEPRVMHRPDEPARVYPRGCGGTFSLRRRV